MEKRTLKILSKGGEWETGYFSCLCAEYLRAWLKVRSSLMLQFQCQRSLFISLGGYTPWGKLSARGLRIILKKLGNSVGIENVSPHAFRRSFATLRIKLGQSTRSVQVLGRWKDLKVFERYTKALDNDDEYRRESAGKYTPLRKIQDEL